MQQTHITNSASLTITRNRKNKNQAISMKLPNEAAKWKNGTFTTSSQIQHKEIFPRIFQEQLCSNTSNLFTKYQHCTACTNSIQNNTNSHKITTNELVNPRSSTHAVNKVPQWDVKMLNYHLSTSSHKQSINYY